MSFTAPALSLLGRHPLPVCCAASVLSGVGQIVSEISFVSPVFDAVFVAGGLKRLHRLASVLERRSELRLGMSIPA